MSVSGQLISIGLAAIIVSVSVASAAAQPAGAHEDPFGLQKDLNSRTVGRLSPARSSKDSGRPSRASGGDAVAAASENVESQRLPARDVPGPAEAQTRDVLQQPAEIDVADSEEHFTALMYAAAEGQLEVVRLLLDHGADAALKDVDGDTAETFARNNGHTEVADLILSSSK